MTEMERQLLDRYQVPEDMRAPILQVWKHYSDKQKWNSNVERLKALEAFYYGLSILTRKD